MSKVSYWKSVDLPKKEWHPCEICAGSHFFFMEGDLHRSAGWIPCQNCDKDGIVRTKLVEVVVECGTKIR